MKNTANLLQDVNMRTLKIITTAIILATSTAVSADWDMPFFGNNNSNNNNWDMPFFGNNSNNGFGDIMNDMTGNMDMDMEMKFKMKAKGNGQGNSNANNYWNSTNGYNNGYYNNSGYAPYAYQPQYYYAPAQAAPAATVTTAQ